MKIISDSEFIQLSAEMKKSINRIHSKAKNLKAEFDSLSSVWTGDDATSVLSAFDTVYPFIDLFYEIMQVYHYYLSHYDIIFKQLEENLGTKLDITC